MKTQSELKEQINRNVYKVGNYWYCNDVRYGDFFYLDTKKEAVETFLNLWDSLDEDEQNRA